MTKNLSDSAVSTQWSHMRISRTISEIETIFENTNEDEQRGPFEFKSWEIWGPRSRKREWIPRSRKREWGPRSRKRKWIRKLRLAKFLSMTFQANLERTRANSIALWLALVGCKKLDFPLYICIYCTLFLQKNPLQDFSKVITSVSHLFYVW